MISAPYNVDKDAQNNCTCWLFVWARPQVQIKSCFIVRAISERDNEWDKIEQLSNVVGLKLYQRILGEEGEIDVLIAQGVKVRTDVVKVLRLQTETILRDQTDVQIIYDSKFVSAITRFRKSHRSVVWLQHSHCRYCDEVVHRIGGCPQVRGVA